MHAVPAVAGTPHAAQLESGAGGHCERHNAVLHHGVGLDRVDGVGVYRRDHCSHLLRTIGKESGTVLTAPGGSWCVPLTVRVLACARERTAARHRNACALRLPRAGIHIRACQGARPHARRDEAGRGGALRTGTEPLQARPARQQSLESVTFRTFRSAESFPQAVVQLRAEHDHLARLMRPQVSGSTASGAVS